MTNAGDLIRVLILGDSEESAESLMRDLAGGGYRPVWKRVGAAEAPADLFDQQSWDLVIADNTLPLLHETQLVALTDGTWDGPPFIFVADGIVQAVAGRTAGRGARLAPAVERVLRAARAGQPLRLAAAHESEERFRQLAENIQEVFWMTDLDMNRMLYISPGYERIWGRTCQSLYDIPCNWLEAIHPNDRDRVRQAMLTKQVAGTYDEEYQIVRPDGTVRWIRDRAFPVKDASGRVHRIVGVVEDITERKRAEETIRALAYYDGLTTLPNRSLLQQRLEHAIEAARADGRPVSLMLMDLDRFREINDTLGHDRGDRLLAEVGARLANVLWTPDQVARMGGDEFAVLLPRIRAAEDVHIVIRKLMRELEAPFMIEGIPVLVECSIGVASFPDHGATAAALLRRAEIAMYAAKRGGSGHAVYSAEQDLYNPRRLALMGELRHAIDHDQLFLQYQPKIALKRGCTIGMEALVRWRHPEHGVIPPDQFIGPAEQTGLIRGLTQWVLREALHRCALGQRSVPMGGGVWVNLSARSLQDPELPGIIFALLQEYRLSPGTLGLEITETAILTDPKQAQRFIARLQAVGVRFSIDDFGTGYSSLANLKRLPVNEIKVDRTFVSGLLDNNGDAAIVRSVVDMAHNFGLSVVAEGVEDQSTYDRLLDLGCDVAQGYHMCPPLAISDLEHWIEQSPWGRPRCKT